MKAFDETPPNQICQKVEEIIQSIRNPTPPEKQPFLTSPNEHFIYTRVLVDYPDDLYNLAHEGSIVSGWINEIYSFWAANMYSLFLFSWDLTNIRSVQTPSPVVCVGYIDGYIIAVYNTGISIFSLPDFTPLNTHYSIPLNVNVTIIKYGIAGCNDGSLRRITLNQSRGSVSISGYLTLKEDNPVIQIIRTKNYFVTLTLNFNISYFTNPKLKRLAIFTELKNILNIWCPYDDVIMAIDNNAILYTLSYKNYRIQVITSYQLIGRRVFQSAIFEHGLLTAVDSDRPSYDSVFTARFGSFPVYSINRNLGGVHSIGSTVSDIKIFSSSGIYTITEKITHDDNEEVWRFCNTINDFWDIPISEINSEWLSTQLSNFFDSDFEFLSTLSNYVLTIIDDFKVLKGSKDEILFSSKILSDFFTLHRDDLFSKLRRISFEIRAKNQSEFTGLSEELEHLFEKAKLGNREAAYEALSIITTTYTKLPPCFRLLCEFMRENGFYKELLDCIILWANSVLPDENALAFENGNFPWKDENTIYSYHLRLCIYEQMDPFLKTAVGITGQHKEEWRKSRASIYNLDSNIEPEVTDQKNAASALQYALNLSNTVFQRYILEFLEDNCPPERVNDFFYPEMIHQMKMMKSRHLPSVLSKKGLKNEAFNLYIEKATLDEVQKTDVTKNLSINDRIKLIDKALDLKKNDEKALKLKKCAELLKKFLIENPNEPQNLFAMDFFDINEKLVNYHEYKLALEVMKIFGEKRTEVLNHYIEETTLDDVKNYVEKNPVFSQYEMAHELYMSKGKDAFNYMFDLNIDNLYICQVFCEALRNGKFRDDIEFIKNVLTRAGQINDAIRQELADVLCEIILELDSNNKIEEANLIRENSKHCFLDQCITDENDL